MIAVLLSSLWLRATGQEEQSSVLPILASPQQTTAPTSVTGDGPIGQPAPDFTLPRLDGGEFTLSDMRSQPVIINFWASWCIPCLEETPLLVDAYHRYSDEGLVVVGINFTEQDTREAAQAFVNEFNVSYPIVLDYGHDVSHGAYNIIGLPVSLFLDRSGLVKRVIVGPIADTEIDLYIAEIMGEDD